MNRPVAVLLLLVLVGCVETPETESIWIGRSAMEVARSEHPAVVLDNRIVVLGGLIELAPGRFGVTPTVEAYDPRADSWTRLADMPQPLHHNMAAVVGDRLFAIGGFSASGFTATDQVWELVGGSWVDRAPLPRAIGAGAAVGLDGRIFVVGGAPGGGLHVYDPADDAWETLPGPSAFREHLAAVVYEGEIWAIGGREPGLIHDTIEIYDQVTNTWRPGPTLDQRRSGFGAAVVGESVYVAGGEVFDPDDALDSTERFDPAIGDWTEYEPLPSGLHGNPLVTVGGTLYVPGGSTRAAGVENAGELWSIDLDRSPEGQIPRSFASSDG